MRKLVMIAAVVLTVFSVPIVALAWHPTVSGDVICDEQSGQYVVTWRVTNTDGDQNWNPEGETMTITSSSRNVFPARTQVPDEGTVSAVERFPGGHNGRVRMKVTAVWPSDQTGSSRTASVELAGACSVPETTRTT
ncbi:MAG: hypothetical protein M3N51_08880, partial [Actinomycetota bacterium]|nr:hypothetical protein [Actinomycetota bacterium]